jgi:hypothetical protein
MRCHDKDFDLPLKQMQHPNIKWIKKNKHKLRKQRSPILGDPSWEDIEEIIKQMATPEDAKSIRQQVNQSQTMKHNSHNTNRDNDGIMETHMNKSDSINQITMQHRSNQDHDDSEHISYDTSASSNQQSRINDAIDMNTTTIHDNDKEGQQIVAMATVLHPVTGQPIKYTQLKKLDDAGEWILSEHDEWLRLNNTGTTRFIRPVEKPKNRKASYYNPQPEHKMKEGILKKRIRGAYGGDQGDEYMGNKAAYKLIYQLSNFYLTK